MNIKDLIENAPISYRRLSKEIGISRQCLHDIVNGTRKPTFYTVKKICAYFNVDWREYVETYEKHLRKTAERFNKLIEEARK